MNNLHELLFDKWIEYSGGSRPKSNTLKFEKMGDEDVRLNVRYVFDWETEETVHLSFIISRKEYDDLVDKLEQSGFARLEKADRTNRLIFEWRITGEKIQIRIELRNSASLDGPITYQLTEFRDLLVDEYK